MDFSQAAALGAISDSVEDQSTHGTLHEHGTALVYLFVEASQMLKYGCRSDALNIASNAVAIAAMGYTKAIKGKSAVEIGNYKEAVSSASQNFISIVQEADKAFGGDSQRDKLLQLFSRAGLFFNGNSRLPAAQNLVTAFGETLPKLAEGGYEDTVRAGLTTYLRLDCCTPGDHLLDRAATRFIRTLQM